MIVAVASLIGACQGGQQAPARHEAGASASPSASPPLARAAAESALRAAAAAVARAAETHDADAMAALYADDALGMYPPPIPFVGREQNRGLWRGVFERPNGSHPILVDSVVVAASADLGYSIGRYGSFFDTPTGRARGGGRYVIVWRWAGDAWRIAVISAHQLEPAPALDRDYP